MNDYDLLYSNWEPTCFFFNLHVSTCNRDFIMEVMTGWFFVTISSYVFIGLNTSFVFKNDKKDIGILQAFTLTLLCWITLTFVGCLPFLLISTNLILLMLFESMSGITTTGATVR